MSNTQLEPLQFAWRYKWLVVACVLVPTIAAVLFATTRPDKYTTSLAFTVNRINKQSTTEYQFDGYYALQASDLFAETVVSWFLTPSVIVEMYDRAGLDPQAESLGSLTSRFKIKKYSSQNIVVKFTSLTNQEASQLSDAVVAVVEEKAAALNQSADRKALFEVVGSKPVIVQDGKGALLAGVVGIVLGAFLSLLLLTIIRLTRGIAPVSPSGTHASGN
ncbi:MAG: hypothetical protein WC786_04720 [Patescibacteria group bacterium]